MFFPQHRLCFWPEPQGHGAFRGTRTSMAAGADWVRFVGAVSGVWGAEGADWVCFVTEAWAAAGGTL